MPPKKKKEEKEEAQLGANRLENFELVKINRAEIQGAEYNPRTITDDAKKKLRKLIKTHGMVQPIIVNKRTGNVVGGHQRLSLMDSELRKQDYELTVAMIDVDHQSEVKLNVALNNTSAQGKWDIDALEQIKIDMPELDFQEDLAFTAVDIENLLFDSDVFFPPAPVRPTVDTREPAPVGMGGGNDDFDDDEFGPEPEENNPQAELDKQAQIDKIKEQKRAYKEEKRGENSEGTSMQVMDDDYTIKLKFNSDEEKWRFMHSIKKPTNETHITPAFLYDLQDGKLSITKKREDPDDEVFVVFQTNSEKADFMKKMRRPAEETLINPSLLVDIERGKVNLKE